MISLRHKLWLGFGSLLLIVVAVSVLSVFFLTSYSHALERVFHENYNSVVFCDHMKDSLDQLDLRAQFLIWQQQAARQIDPGAWQKQFDDNLAAELNNCTLPGEWDHATHPSGLWGQYKSKFDQLHDLAPDQRREFYPSDLLPLHRSIKQASQDIADMNMSNMVSVDGKVKRTLLAVRNVLLILVIAATLAAATVVGIAGATILSPLKALTRSARQIEVGNLDLSLPIRSRDEVGQLAEAFNSMAAKLREFRRHDHDRLLLAQQTTQLAIDSLPDAVFIINSRGIVEISNLAARSYFGIEPALNVQQLATHKWLLPLYDSIRQGKKPHESPGYRSAVQLFEGGEEKFLLPRAVPMLGSDHSPIGVAFILVDVTRLRAADEAKSGIVSTVSHELRTPLTSIRMALSLLAGDKFGPLTEKQNALLKAAREDSDRLYRIVENLLSISRIESGRAQFQLRSMPCRDIVLQAVEPMRAPFAEKHISLDVDMPLSLPDVLADPGAVGSALTNLLSNALKYTPPGGQTRVTVSPENDMVSFTVTDTGPGIPDEFSQRIFDRFFRVPREDGPTGAGLGLAIAKEVIEAHGGTIELCRGFKTGSQFRFTLRQAGRSSAHPSISQTQSASVR